MVVVVVVVVVIISISSISCLLLVNQFDQLFAIMIN